MVTELSRQLQAQTAPGDRVICAVSGGADSVALLFGAYLLKEKLGIQLEAAHFNHGLRGAESDGDEAFVRQLCHQFDIPLHVGRSQVVAGKKGLEAAARDARYAFFSTLEGKIATAHTADDNAETVLLHLIRGTGLKGLGGITPIRGNILRPMLSITRQQVLEFLKEYNLTCRTDSSNRGDDFLRNRLRHHVMPLLKEENPRLAENLSAMALRLRQDEEALAQAAQYDVLPDVTTLRSLPPALRSRMLERFLKENGVKEPEAEHIALAEQLVFSDRPSARGNFPGGVTIGRVYERLEALGQKNGVIPRGEAPWESPYLTRSGNGIPLTEGLPHQSADGFAMTALPEGIATPVCGLVRNDLKIDIACQPAEEIINTPDCFTVCPQGEIRVRSRQTGDVIRLPGGSKSLKKLFIDRKIPAHQRDQIPVVVDDLGILGVWGIGPDQNRIAHSLPAVQIRFNEKE